jgi:hypothetical protein
MRLPKLPKLDRWYVTPDNQTVLKVQVWRRGGYRCLAIDNAYAPCEEPQSAEEAEALMNAHNDPIVFTEAVHAGKLRFIGWTLRDGAASNE